MAQPGHRTTLADYQRLSVGNTWRGRKLSFFEGIQNVGRRRELLKTAAWGNSEDGRLELKFEQRPISNIRLSCSPQGHETMRAPHPQGRLGP